VARGVFDTGGAPAELFVAEHMNLPADRRKEIEIDLTDAAGCCLAATDIRRRHGPCPHGHHAAEAA